jgi:hypothetical protein
MLGSRFRRLIVVVAGVFTLGLAVAAPAQASPAPSQNNAPVTIHTQAVVHRGIVNPSVKPCGKASISLQWSIVSVTVTGGVITNSCRAGTYVQVFLTWRGHGSIKLGTAGPISVRHVPRMSWRTAFPGHITVTTCEHFNGWHCGAGQSV